MQYKPGLKEKKGTRVISDLIDLNDKTKEKYREGSLLVAKLERKYSVKSAYFCRL